MLRIAFVLLALAFVAALFRTSLGNTISSDRALSITQFQRLPNFDVVPGKTSLVAGAPGFLETLLAPLWFAGETAQTLGPTGIPVFLVSVLVVLGAWFGLAWAGGWRRPPVVFALLVALQLFGASYWLVSFRAPARKLKTPFTAFDFHTHTTFSSGLLTPQQQINWHRARGFSGLAFTDSDRLMDADQLSRLRANNRDMVLINGQEFRGNKHVLLFGLKNSISSKTTKLDAALAQAKKQNAIVIAPHSWSPKEEPRAAGFITRGANAVEAWNGIVFDEESLRAARAQNVPAIATTDTVSKSGARCFTWTILPRGLDETKVLRALRLKKTAVATTLTPQDSSQSYDTQRRAQKKPLALFKAIGAAWRTLSGAQKTVTSLCVLASLLALWSWGAQSPRESISLSGPSRVVNFLKRRRLAARVPGAFFMLLAWVGSILAAIYCLSWTQKFVPGIGPLHALGAWILCDVLYLYGRALWKSAA